MEILGMPEDSETRELAVLSGRPESRNLEFEVGKGKNVRLGKDTGQILKRLLKKFGLYLKGY